MAFIEGMMTLAVWGQLTPIVAAAALTLEQTAYAFDSTTIDLCLALFPWAAFRKQEGAVKLHTLLDLCGGIPCFMHVSDGKMHDFRALDELPIEPGPF